MGNYTRTSIRCHRLPTRASRFVNSGYYQLQLSTTGGSKIILKYAGKDATETYEPIHPPDTLDKYLDKSKHLGEVDMSTVKKEQEEEDPDEEARQERIKTKPILEQCYNLMDFESVARKVMKKTAWAYYSSGADDEIVRRTMTDIGWS